MADLTWKQRRRKDFENAKAQCLGKRDKSFQGRIDPRAVDICALINERDDCYTTSSCAGRCFLYCGSGVKATTDFLRFRISHEKIKEPESKIISTRFRFYFLSLSFSFFSVSSPFHLFC